MNTIITIIIISLILSAFFSGMEIAFVSSNKLRLELDKKQGKFYTKITDIFIENPSNYISTMLVGNNIVLVIYGMACAKLLDQPIRQILNTNSDSIVLISQTIISTLVVLVTAEFLPKAICKINPNGVLKFFAIPVFFFYIILYPIASFTSFVAKIFLRILGKKITDTHAKKIFNRADLLKLTSEVAKHEEEIESEHEHDIKIFQNALDFPDVKVRDCMIPRTEIEAAERTEDIGILLEKFINSGFSRILIYKDNIDNIIGYVNSKDLFKKDSKTHDILRPIQFVPETMPANKLLKKFIKERQSLAVVVDEFGGTAGIISIEDILEEILGDISDEHDNDELVEKDLGDKKYIFSGRLEIEQINTTYNLNIPESEDYDTLAGYILFVNERIPKPMDIIIVGNFRVKILKMSANRIDLVHLTVVNTDKN